MEPLGKPALHGHSCEDVQSSTTRSPLLLTKRRNKARHLIRDSVRLQFLKYSSLLSSFKSLIYIKCSSSPIKAQAILSDTTVRTSSVDHSPGPDFKSCGH